MAVALRLQNTDQVALVNAERVDALSVFSWIYLNGYVVRQVRTRAGTSTLIYLHRQIVSAYPWEVVDHEDGNRLNNQDGNLRRASHSQNGANRASPMPWGYRGVYPECNGSWRAQIKVNQRSKRLGTYPTAIAAALAYDAAARVAFGPFARLNFPELGAEQLELPGLPAASPAELDLSAVPAAQPRGMDFYELSYLRRVVGCTGGNLAETDTSDCDIPY